MQKLRRALTDAFVSIDGASYFLVMKTLPGNAHSIGSLSIIWIGQKFLEQFVEMTLV